MFGKPEWFREKTIGWGLFPITWQGWAYALVWTGLIIGPFIGLLSTGRVPESLVWMGASIGFVCWDVRQIMGEMHAAANPPEDLFYIDEETDTTQLATRSYDLHIRD